MDTVYIMQQEKGVLTLLFQSVSNSAYGCKYKGCTTLLGTGA